MAEQRYEQARATKVSTKRDYDGGGWSKSDAKRATRKIKKSPLLIVIALSLVVGIVGGFFLTKATTTFKMNNFYVGGVASAEVDYVLVDMTSHKERIIDADQKSGTPVGVTTDMVYQTMKLKDEGVTAKFFGKDISDTVTVKYYYREDISHDKREVSGIDVSTAGVYYIEYTSSHFAHKNTTLIRTIIVTEVEVDG